MWSSLEPLVGYEEHVVASVCELDGNSPAPLIHLMPAGAGDVEALGSVTLFDARVESPQQRVVAAGLFVADFSIDFSVLVGMRDHFGEHLAAKLDSCVR